MDDFITYAIGDVHGCLPELRAALAWAAEDAAALGASGKVVLLGDFVDRGPDSRGVVELLMEGPRDAHMEWLPLRGNHDDMLATVWRFPEHPQGADWWEHGGQRTLASYGWDPLTDPVPSHLGRWIPKAHADFLSRLPLVHADADRIFVHAGLRPGVDLADQSDRDLMWIRGDFLHSGHDFGRLVVHGHTPDKANPRHHGNRLALDAGCPWTGELAVAAFDPGSPVPRLHVASAERGPAADREGPRPPIC